MALAITGNEMLTEPLATLARACTSLNETGEGLKRAEELADTAWTETSYLLANYAKRADPRTSEVARLSCAMYDLFQAFKDLRKRAEAS